MISFNSYSQKYIDTSSVNNVREEWRINENSSDSTLTEILTEYQSGIIKQEFPTPEEESKYGFYSFYEKDSLGNKIFHIQALNSVYSTYFYSKEDQLDSIISYVDEKKIRKVFNNTNSDTLPNTQSGLKGETFIYDKKNRLVFETNTFEDIEYQYGEKEITKEIKYYKGHKIIKEQTRYIYDLKGRLMEKIVEYPGNNQMVIRTLYKYNYPEYKNP
ncbi:hypothetical protein FHG64_15845 [Antarcticibacterium flavum]|uniref:RHS repeat protein n=1 Tax=Antarcticibacterium flavum TaxID=2058175 RepID=A0A5B7X6L4_9FLAO|nr:MULTISPECIES: hypothetical protein [Antarcticibacterium]QCY70745.1 hypothetical protein FHG64_15845 [Antarcticibacterium flavum]